MARDDDRKNLSDWIGRSGGEKPKRVRSNNPALDTTGSGATLGTKISLLVAFISVTALIIVATGKGDFVKSEDESANSMEHQVSEMVKAPAQLPQETVSHCSTSARIAVSDTYPINGGVDSLPRLAHENQLSSAQVAGVVGAMYATRTSDPMAFVPRVKEASQHMDNPAMILAKVSPMPLNLLTEDIANTAVRSLYSSGPASRTTRAKCSLNAHDVWEGKDAVQTAKGLIATPYIRSAGSILGPGTLVDGTTGIGQVNLVRHAWWEHNKTFIPDGASISEIASSLEPGPDAPGAAVVIDDIVIGVSLGNGRMVFSSPEEGAVVEAPSMGENVVFYPIPENGGDIAINRRAEELTGTGPVEA